MNILLIHPPDSRQSIAPGRFEPLALEVLAATVPGHKVDILDLRLDSVRELDNFLRYRKPDIIGVTANNTIHVKAAQNVMQHIRERKPGTKLITGGHHVTMMPQDFRKPFVDAIFYGWAEKSFPAYIDSLANGQDFSHIQGIEILDRGETVFKSNNHWDIISSDIPLPRRDLVQRYYGKYLSDTGHRTSLVNTSRGCPYRCSFCSIWKANSGKFFLVDIEQVYQEIASLPGNVDYVFFADDNTFINPDRALKLALMLEKAGIRKRYSVYCRSDTITRHPDIMKVWKRIGLNNLCVGFEVTNDDELKEVNKSNAAAHNESAARILNELRIPFRPHFLISPDFEKEKFREIARYIKKNKLMSPIFPILTPIPGSDNYEKVMDKIMLDYNYFDYAHTVLPTRLSLKEFYWSWIRLFNSSYPMGRNIRNYILSAFARITRNEALYKRSYHIDMMNLFKLKLFAVYVILKLVFHYRSVEKRQKQAAAVYPLGMEVKEL